MLIYIKLLSLLCLIEASLYPIDAKGSENGYHYKVFPIENDDNIKQPMLRTYGIIAMDDYYDGSTRRGTITITRRNSAKQYFYDLSSNEAFIIYGNDTCTSIDLTPEKKQDIVRQWADFLPTNITDGALGPAAFLLTKENSFSYETFKSIWSFEKLIFKPGLHLPYGFGCKRPLKYDQVVPILAVESPSFILKMEANLYYNSIDSISMVKHNGIFSYDVSGDPPLRIIHVPSLLIDYIIDRSTDHCYFTESILVKGSYLRWPYDRKYFTNNLLSPSLLKLERHDLNYFGAERLESINYEIFEKSVDNFWLTDAAIGPTIITYFIPTGVKKRPIKIRMLQFNGKSHREYWITYQDSIDGFTDDPSRFDLRNCFNKEPTWLQIVFPVVPRGLFSIKYLDYLLESELRKKLDFIPINRLPVIKVGHYGPSIYVTVGLLEGVDIRLEYIDSTLSLNPSSSEIEDSDKSCSFLCSDNPDCHAFSYCHNRRCNLFNIASSQTISLPIVKANCTLFVSRTLNIESDEKKDQLNQIASTSKLLHMINLMIQQQELNLEIDTVWLSAQHLFTVSHPDELGGYGEMYKDVVGQRMQLNEYKIVMDSYELIGNNQLFGLAYIDCLTYCQNDDDCSTISYCATGSGECIISSLSADEIVANSTKYTELNDRCSISEKSYIGNFDLLPGRSLGKPALREIKGKSPEDCAKACMNEKSFNCDAFDHCSPDLINTHCYLYNFHSDANVLAKSSLQIWNNEEKSCNHYARKLSKDYSQFIGRKFSGHDSVIATIEQNSLENCASACSSVQENCFSFEYCQFTDETRSPNILRRCRLSSEQILTQDEHIKKTSDFCSVYSILRNNDHVQRSLPLDKPEEHPHFYLTLFLGFIATISGTIISAFLTSLFLAKKRS